MIEAVRDSAGLHAVDEEEQDASFERALRLAPAGVTAGQPITFRPGSNWDASWALWSRGLFRDVLAPAMLDVSRLAAAGQAREIAELDAALHAALDPIAREGSLRAGRRTLEHLRGVRGNRWLQKLIASAQDGSFQGHFATLHACQCACFHLPVRWVAPTYAWWEWRAATRDDAPIFQLTAELTAFPSPGQPNGLRAIS